MTLKEFKLFALANENNICRLKIKDPDGNRKWVVAMVLLVPFGFAQNPTGFICLNEEHSHGQDWGPRADYKHSYAIFDECCAEEIEIESFVSEDDF
jgi:hypothetical protein